jgi:hypothetical protein
MLLTGSASTAGANSRAACSSREIAYIIRVSLKWGYVRLQLTVCKGTKEMNEGSDVWCDTDYEHPSDLDWCRDEEEFQEGYYWTCCNATGDVDGCSIRSHLVRSSKVAR